MEGLSFPRKRETRIENNGFRIKCGMTTTRIPHNRALVYWIWFGYQELNLYCSSLSKVRSTGLKQTNEIRTRTTPEINSRILFLGSLQRLSHCGMAASAGCPFASSPGALRAAANCRLLALG